MMPRGALHEIRLTPSEFNALLDRLSPDYQRQAELLMPAGRHQFRLHPVTFWVKADEWEEYLLRGILHMCAAKWKDVLTEPTLVKLRALLTPKDAPPTDEPIT